MLSGRISEWKDLSWLSPGGGSDTHHAHPGAPPEAHYLALARTTGDRTRRARNTHIIYY